LQDLEHYSDSQLLSRFYLNFDEDALNFLIIAIVALIRIGKVIIITLIWKDLPTTDWILCIGEVVVIAIGNNVYVPMVPVYDNGALKRKPSIGFYHHKVVILSHLKYVLTEKISNHFLCDTSNEEAIIQVKDAINVVAEDIGLQSALVAAKRELEEIVQLSESLRQLAPAVANKKIIRETQQKGKAVQKSAFMAAVAHM